MKEEKAITLIALVITIIVLLILAGVTINLVVGDNGIIGRAKESKIETRGASVEEERNLWMLDREASMAADETPKTMDQILQELVDKNLLSEEEVQRIKESAKKEITIGSRTISFKITGIENVTDIFDETGEQDGMLHIGDYVKYTPDSEIISYEVEAIYSGHTINEMQEREELNWRVFDYKDGKIRLISEVPTTSKMTLFDYQGYNNAVYLINKVCEMYGGTKGTAKGIAIEDVQDKLSYAYQTYSNGEYSYGAKGPNPSDPKLRNYPNIFSKEMDTGVKLGQSEQTELISGTNSGTMSPTQTYWQKTMQTDGSDFHKPIYQNMLIAKNGTNYDGYWVASRAVNTFKLNTYFHIHNIKNGIIGGEFPYYSNGKKGVSNTLGVRPIVTLNANVQIDTKNAMSDHTKLENAWILK